MFSLNLSSWEWVMASICIYGFGSGVTAGIYRLLLLETVGLEAYPSAMAGAASIGAFLFLTVAPLMGEFSYEHLATVRVGGIYDL